MELASTLKSEFVNIRHTLEEDKLTVEYSLKPKDEILALLSARLQKASDELDRSPGWGMLRENFETAKVTLLRHQQYFQYQQLEASSTSRLDTHPQT